MLHIVNFFPKLKEAPCLFVEQNGEHESVSLSGKKVMNFSSLKACTGYGGRDGQLTCMNRAINTRQCPTCAYLDKSRAFTVGDFSLYPELYEECKKQEYSIYVAGFGQDIKKCGITRKERLLERWVEQGADFAAEIGVFLGPDEVYSVEETVQNQFGLTNAVRADSKMRRLEFDYGKAKLGFEQMLASILESGLLSENVGEMKVREMREYYPDAKGASARDEIDGSIVGAKGQLLFYEKNGNKFVVNMRDKISRYVEE